MITCDLCQEPIKSEDDGYVDIVETSNENRTKSPLELHGVGPHALIATIAVRTQLGDRSPDYGYHYHPACMANMLREALDSDYPLTSGSNGP